MAKKLQLKDSSIRLKVNGIGEVDNSNITAELYERLKKINPAYGDMFHEVESAEPKESKSKSTKENKNDIQTT